MDESRGDGGEAVGWRWRLGGRFLSDCAFGSDSDDATADLLGGALGDASRAAQDGDAVD